MLIGIDEVGRGALAGPLVVACVSLKNSIEGLRDSKKLTIKKRIDFYSKIFINSNLVSLGWVWPHEIDRYGLTKSMEIAILRALNNLKIDSNVQIILDGNVNYLKDKDFNVRTMIKADDLINEVSAASIIAKVTRDNYMKELAKYYPLYNFNQNVGYGTKDHLSAIRKIGPTQIHRSLFLRKII